MSALGIGIGLAAVGTGLKAYEGFSQESKSNAIQKNLKDPIYNIPPEFEQNRNIARQLAQQGLPQSVINEQTNRINQNEAGAIQALSNSANPGSGVTSVVRQGNAAGATLAAEDAQARNNNQRYFIQENKAVGDQKLAKQQSDVFDKYTRNYNEMQAYRGAGMQNLNSAVNDATQLGEYGLMSASGQQTQQPQYKNVGGQWYAIAADGSLSPMQGMIPQGQGVGLPPLQLQNQIAA